jgi:hypothetical protein
MAASASDDDTKRIKWLMESNTGYSIIGVIINTGTVAYTRKDGIHVVPAALLGA